MSRYIHSVEVPDGFDHSMNDRVGHGITQLAVAAGAAGATVSVAVTGVKLPNNYVVTADLGQAGVVGIAHSKTNTGFTVDFTPMTSGTAVASGTAQVTVEY